jgi:hypothetical protein
MFGGAAAIALALRRVQPGDLPANEFESAVRLILYDIWPFFRSEAGESELVNILHETWAGSVLARMQAHSAARDAERRARAEYEAGAEKRKEEKRLLKQQRHAARPVAKAERDRLWREKQRTTEK